MKRSEHEAIIREHLSALAWSSDRRARGFVAELASRFGIFEAHTDDIERQEKAKFMSEHKRFHVNKPKRKYA